MNNFHLKSLRKECVFLSPFLRHCLGKNHSGTLFLLFLVSLKRSKYIRTLNEMAYFGERALFVKEKSSATATAKTPVEVFTISQEDFMANM